MPHYPKTLAGFSRAVTSASGTAFEQLAQACHESGPLDEKTRRFIKIALAIGAGLEGATHSAVRHAKESGASQAELDQVAILAITTLGFPSAMRALTWLDDHDRS